MYNVAKVIIGALLHDNGLIAKTKDLLNLDRIPDAKDRMILEVIFELETPVDITTLMDKFKVDRTMPGYLFECWQSCYAPENVESYIALVDKSYNRKQLQLAASRMQEQLAQDNNDAVYEFMGIVDQIDKNTEVSLRSLADIGKVTVEDLEGNFNKGSEYTGIPCGFKVIDDILCGMQRQNLIVIAARTGMGKTLLALNMAMNIGITQQQPVLFFSLEMSEKELYKRMLSRVTLISSSIIKSCKFTNDDWQRILDGVVRLNQSKLYIEDKSYTKLADIRTKARRLQQQQGLAAIFVDYISLIGEKGDNEVQRHGIISHGLKALAKDLDVPVIVLSQLNREAEKDRPIVSHIRSSGEIEQDADVIMLIYREEVYKPNSLAIKNVADIDIAKHRSGCVGKVQLAYDLDKCAFYDMEH